jgi:predicted  nucleic acid-binding Zn-ribbon protein
MSKKNSGTVEEKLRSLYDLQIIDSRIDQIRIVRGELPLEVQDLEDEIAGMNARLDKYRVEIEGLDGQIADKKNTIEEAKTAIKKYEGQQSKVRNNREFDSLNKEIEFQQLEIQLSEKRIKEYTLSKEQKQEVIGNSDDSFSELKNDLDIKKGELGEIIEETKKEEEYLVKKSEVLEENIEDRLLKAYKRIRTSSKNGLAVVSIDREASAGSFIKIPPQKQLDVAARKKLIVDEHSGRILVDKVLAEEQVEKMEKALAKELKK